jgi:adenosylcobyric acid synthase
VWRRIDDPPERLVAEDQALLCGFIVNKFRGDPAVLAPGLEKFSRLTNRPFLGTLPYVPGLGFDGEIRTDLTQDA